MSETAAGNGAPIQDPGKRADLIQAIGEVRLKELLALVPAEIQKVIAVIDEIQASDAQPPADTLEVLHREAHGLKGVAVNYGLARLAQVAGAVQDYRRTLGDIDLLRRKLQECSGELLVLMDE